MLLAGPLHAQASPYEAPRLCRASHILNQAEQLDLTAGQLKEYTDLLDDVQGAHAPSA